MNRITFIRSSPCSPPSFQLNFGNEFKQDSRIEHGRIRISASDEPEAGPLMLSTANSTALIATNRWSSVVPCRRRVDEERRPAVSIAVPIGASHASNVTRTPWAGTDWIGQSKNCLKLSKVG